VAAERADWAVGYEDEAWWSRVAQPALHARTAGDPVRLVAPAVASDDPDPKALACYGLLVRPGQDAAEEVWLRFVDGRPVSAVTTAFLGWCGDRLAATGIATLVPVWDNAAWHASRAVRAWLREHNRHAHRAGGVRIVPCSLPTKSPWLNPIEPKWVHAKRRIAEPARGLSPKELEDRACAAFACPASDHLSILQEVA
jgi:hypothetical protein